MTVPKNKASVPKPAKWVVPAGEEVLPVECGLEEALHVAPSEALTDGPATHWLDSHEDGWGMTLSDAEKESLGYWKKEIGYKAINDYLRDGKITEGVEAHVANIDAAIATSKAVTTEMEVVAYRGVTDIRKALGDDIKVGKEIIDPGFTSASTEAGVALDYSMQGALIRLELPPGTNLAWLRSAGVERRRSDYYDTAENRELVLPRNARFVVTDVSRSNKFLMEGEEVELNNLPVVTLRLETKPEVSIGTETHLVDPEEWTASDFAAVREWVKPPTPKSAGLQKAGGYSSDRAFGTNTAMGDWAEEKFAGFVHGRRLVGGENVRQGPFDVQADGILFEVKAVSTESSRFAAWPKKAEIAAKEAAAKEAGLRPAIVVPILDRDAGTISYYWREGVKGGRVSENTGWKHLGTETVDDWPTVIAESIEQVYAPSTPSATLFKELADATRAEREQMIAAAVTAKEKAVAEVLIGPDNVKAIHTPSGNLRAAISYKVLPNEILVTGFEALRWGTFGKRLVEAITREGLDRNLPVAFEKLPAGPARSLAEQVGYSVKNGRLTNEGGAAIDPGWDFVKHIQPATPPKRGASRKPSTNRILLSPASNLVKAFSHDKADGASVAMASKVKAAVGVLDKLFAQFDEHAPKLTQIAVHKKTNTNNHGTFYADVFAGDTPEIDVNLNGFHYANQSVESTVWHEWGHYLDWDHLDRRKTWASMQRGEAVGVMDAIRGSSGYKTLVAKGGGWHSEKHLKYLLEDRELFARAFAQYVRTRAESLENLPAEERTAVWGARAADQDRAKFNSQWAEADFKPIKKEFDDMFYEMGWLRK